MAVVWPYGRRVTCTDLNRIEHTVEVTAESLYEAAEMSLNRGLVFAVPSGHSQG